MPPLDETEARGIIKGICDRYHRSFEPQVVEALLSKSAPSGRASGHPLWVVLAAEELNLLDEDDFSRAQRSYTGAPAERLRNLLIDTVHQLPPDVPGLYGATIDRAAGLFGAPLTDAFLGMVAVGRAGWRENDFRAVLPKLSGEAWDGLRFAQLRRLFRGQMRQRGALGQWDFNHVQMRIAALSAVAAGAAENNRSHAAIADHLLSLSSTDPLRQTETMVHLVASEAWPRAAAYYADEGLSEEEIEGATLVLADIIINSSSTADTLALIGPLINASGLDDFTRGNLLVRIQSRLRYATQWHLPLETRHVLATTTREALERLYMSWEDYQREGSPKGSPGRWIPGLLESNLRSGDDAVGLGDLPEGLKYYRKAHIYASALSEAEPWATSYKCELSASFENVGAVLRKQGNPSEALNSYREALAVIEPVAATNHVDPIVQRRYSVCLSNLADMLWEQGVFTDAVQHYRSSLEIDARDAASQPDNLDRQRDLLVSQLKFGHVLLAQRQAIEAAQSFQKAYAIAERLTKADPSNLLWQRDMSLCLFGTGEALGAQGNIDEKMATFRKGLSISEELVTRDPGDTGKLGDLSVSLAKLGDALFDENSLFEALQCFESALAIVQKLVATDNTNSFWRLDGAAFHERIGSVLIKQGNVIEAYNYLNISSEIAKEIGGTRSVTLQNLISTKLYAAGNMLFDRDDLVRSLQFFNDARAIGNRLLQHKPDDERLRSDPVTILIKMSEVFLRQDDLKAATRNLHDCQMIVRGNHVLQRGLMIQFSQVGAALEARGETAEAFDCHDINLGLARGLVAADPQPMATDCAT